MMAETNSKEQPCPKCDGDGYYIGYHWFNGYGLWTCGCQLKPKETNGAEMERRVNR